MWHHQLTNSKIKQKIVCDLSLTAKKLFKLSSFQGSIEKWILLTILMHRFQRREMLHRFTGTNKNFPQNNLCSARMNAKEKYFLKQKWISNWVKLRNFFKREITLLNLENNFLLIISFSVSVSVLCLARRGQFTPTTKKRNLHCGASRLLFVN